MASIILQCLTEFSPVKSFAQNQAPTLSFSTFFFQALSPRFAARITFGSAKVLKFLSCSHTFPLLQCCAMRDVIIARGSSGTADKEIYEQQYGALHLLVPCETLNTLDLASFQDTTTLRDSDLLMHLPHLRKLKLNQNPSIVLPESFPSQLRQLQLSTSNVQDSDLKHIGSCCPLLEVLDLSHNCDISDHGLSMLVDKKNPLKRMTEFDISYSGKDGKLGGELGLRCIGQGMHALRNLDLRKLRAVESRGSFFLGELELLERLNVAECPGVNDDFLEVALTTGHLLGMNLYKCTGISYRGAEYIAEHHNTLKGINLGGLTPSLTDGAIEILSKCGSLMWLDVNFNDMITDAGALSLAKMANLQSLHVSWCTRITEIGVRALLMGLKKLAVLSVTGIDGMTDELLELLPAAIERLDVSCCDNVSSGKVKQLRAARPSLKIQTV